ncbi:YqaA family protein [Parvibaculum sp.]|jgi:membrane protein YqaA with SNARE-associated domain|uniref:YqaA family protein n=1 Tax=Parvibaculum sp. TaxID=2024848 RepID=UPI00261EBA07|nr:YqaA family protein [Parvibaculum sp.]MCW5728489.1 DedA family protein [Parvibaculum sp.]MDO9127409.1 YqaA family protein [Parvibaculum sp.]MDP1626882.1 YqaA family protein [Parvibaculum sp.]MDP2148528.1 YqaA family protein [Parvibaculum sp.]MDP3329303.1 YqaA family protein [Parvibaculum sp.]
MLDLAAYAGLFLSAFVAATLLPMQSEAVLVGLLMTETYPVWALVAVASAGNILGSAVNWGLGRAFMHLDARPWFPVSAAKIEQASGWYRRYGRWSLLLSWMPIVGDPLTLVAGILREPFPTFLALVAIAKTLRYIVLAATAINLG